MANEQKKKFRDPKKGRNLLDSFHAELIEAMESGKTLAWQEDWKGETPPLPYNGASQNPYTGINIFLLEKDRENKADPRFYTFKQVEGIPRLKVSKGAKASKIVFFDMENQFPQRDKKTKEIVMNSKGEPLMVKTPFIDVYNVFNGSQLEGLPPYEKKNESGQGRGNGVAELFSAILSVANNTIYPIPTLPWTERVRNPTAAERTAVTAAVVSERIIDDQFKHIKPAERALRMQVATYLLCREYGIQAPLKDIFKDQTEQFRSEWAEILKTDRKAFTKAARDASKVLNKVREIERSNEKKRQEQTQELTPPDTAAAHANQDSIKNEAAQASGPKIEYVKQEAPSIPDAGVSAADIDTAKVAAQHIINNEALMKDDMVNEGHEKVAVDAAIQSKRFLNDRPRNETYATELTRIRKESGKDVKIIEGKVNKYYGPGKLKLYEKTAVLSLSRNLKIAYDINDLKGQLPEAKEKDVPIRGMKLFVDRTDNKETRGIHITPAKEKSAENER